MNRLVGLALPPGPRFVEELRRILNSGDAALPIDVRLSRSAQLQIVSAMQPHELVGPDGDRELLEGGVPVEPGDALVMATSGTTGDAKGVVLTRDAIASSARAVNRRLSVSAGDSWWACLPFAHVGGLSVVLRAWEAEISCEAVEGFSEMGAEEALERGATLTSLVPTALGRLGPEVSRRFRRIVLGGQAPPASLPENVSSTYGMTETGSGVVYDGDPLEGVEVRTDPGSGEISLRGPMLLRAYRDGTDPKDEAGWLATGDSGVIGADGKLTVWGRIGDLVITGGENVWPAAVEPIIERHPAVARAAVGGRPDPEWGERLTAYVQLRPGAQAEPAVLLAELRDRVRDELASFAAPREVVVVDELPTTALGKIRRGGLIDLRGPSALR